jgi:hypothetical protein
MTNDKGEIVDVPRPAIGLRVWDPTTESYSNIDPFLAGAPATAEAVDEWLVFCGLFRRSNFIAFICELNFNFRFVGVVRTLKASDYIGSALLDRLATSERTVSTEPELEVAGSFSNHWTDLVLSTGV